MRIGHSGFPGFGGVSGISATPVIETQVIAFVEAARLETKEPPNPTAPAAAAGSGDVRPLRWLPAGRVT